MKVETNVFFLEFWSKDRSFGLVKMWLYDNSDQRRIRTENQIRTKDKFGPNFEIRPKLFR